MYQLSKQDEEFILSYLQKLDIKPAKSNKQFWRHIYTKYGVQVQEKLAEIVDNRANGNSDGDLYEAKNETLELSLDFARYSADLYRRYFEWFITKSFKPQNLLDLGCDNGIVTCFFAMFFPNSKIVGIDISENGIKCACQLAERLDLKNVTFLQADIHQASEIYPKDTFDMIISVRSLHEIIGSLLTGRYWSLTDVAAEAAKQQEDKQLKLASDLINVNGIFIAWERCDSSESTIWMIEKFRQIGLFANWSECEFINFHELGETEKMPVIVFDKLHRKKSTSEGVGKLYLKDELIDIKKRTEYSDVAAELLLSRFIDKKLIEGIQVNCSDGSGSSRMEFWRTDCMLLVYEYRNDGYRSLKLLPLEFEDRGKEELYKAAAIYSDAGNEVVHYSNINERDKLDT